MEFPIARAQYVPTPSCDPQNASSEPSTNRRSVAFVLSTSLTAGAGTEQFVLNIVKSAPQDRFRIIVVQTDMQDAPRLDPQYVKRMLGGTSIYTIRSFRRNLRKLGGASNYFSLAVKQFVTFVLGILYRTLNGPTLDLIRNAEVIYLVRNDDLSALKTSKDTVIIGSTHSSTLGLSSNGLSKLRILFRVLKYRRIDGIHFTSAKWLRRAVIRKRYDFLLPLGIDATLYYPRQNKDKVGTIKFLFVSRLEAEKGVMRLLEAWKLLKLENAELHIAGTGSLSSLIKKVADGKHIVYHGVLSTEDLAMLYGNCNAFVFPAQGEIYGLVALEALASGLFAIVSDDLRGNFDEFEQMGVLEYVRNDPLAISTSMSRVASRLDELQDSLRQSSNYVRASYDWGSISVRLFSRFERILEEEKA